MKTLATFFLFTFLATALSGCYDLINRPLSGVGGDKAIFSIAGQWLEKNGTNSLEILETSEPDEFIFSYTENGNLWKGKVETSYYGENVALNLDMLSLTLNGDKLVVPNEPLYLLLGLKKKGNKIEIIKADMNKFKKVFAKYFYATLLDSHKACVGNKEPCKTALSGNYVLSPARTKKFNYDFGRAFSSIFPRNNAVTFELVK